MEYAAQRASPRFGRLLETLDQVARRLTQALTLVILCVLAAQVFFRFVLNQSLIWSEEVSGWCMVWVVFMGGISLMRRDEHVSIPIFITMLPPTVRAAAVIAGRLATIVAAAFVAWYGARVVVGTFHIVSQTTGINTRYIKLCVPIGAALMALFACVNLAMDLRRWGREGAAAVAVPGVRRTEESKPERSTGI
jgi:TRAP-type C4-dicarboxylate transport system permease small subunit